jgi:hypothetical protein
VGFHPCCALQALRSPSRACTIRSVPLDTFNIGEAFPADDEVARFVVGLAMIRNDWHRAMELMPKELSEDAEVQGVRLMLVRQEAASCFEGAKFVTDAIRRSDKIKAFATDLGAEARQHLSRMTVAHDWIEAHRNVTAHYPKIEPNAYANGNEEMGMALQRAGEQNGTISFGQTEGSLRFHFADTVALMLLPVTDDPDLIKRLSEARIAFGDFATVAIDRYCRDHAGAFTRTGT